VKLGVRWLLIVGAALFTAACIRGGDDTALSAEEVADRYGYVVENADLTPSYAIVPGYESLDDAYARDLLARDCLGDVVPYQPMHPDETGKFVDERTGQVVFDEEIAAEWGYSADRLESRPDTAVPDDVTVTDEILDEMTRCGERADERLGDPPARPIKAIEDAGWDAVGASEELEDAYRAWAECMEPQGVIDLPDAPSEMPSKSVQTEGSRIETAPDVFELDDSVLPDQREIDVAVADARCRDELDIDGITRRVRATAELEAIGENLEAFEAARADYQDYQRRLDEVIAEFGG